MNTVIYLYSSVVHIKKNSSETFVSVQDIPTGLFHTEAALLGHQFDY